MDDEVKSRFEEAEKRSAGIEKRFDDLKWYFGGVTTLFTIGFSVLTIVFSWNYNSEKADLRESQKELKATLDKIDLPPELEILALNGSSIAGQEVAAHVEADKDGNQFLVFSHFLRNRGEGGTGQLFLKLYTNGPIRFDTFSSDNSSFKYETYLNPADLDPKEIPGKFSNQWYLRFFLPGKPGLKAGHYPCLLKIFYGKGRVAEAPITLVVGQTVGAG